jgi:hypothetical protein
MTGEISIDKYVTWSGEVRPLGKGSAIRGEYLETVVLPVSHEHAAICMDPDTVTISASLL